MKLVLKALSAFFSSLPLGAALAMGRGIGWFLGAVARYRRVIVQEALARCFPEKTPQERRAILRRSYANLGMNISEMLRLPKLSEPAARELVTVEGLEHARRAHEKGKGVVVLCGHIGNWELLAAVTPLFGYPLTIIAKAIKNPSLQAFWSSVRQRFGSRVLPAHGSYRPCLKALRSGEIVGFILDQNMTREEGVFVDFFGKPACTTPGLAYMAAQAGAPVLPVFILRSADARRHVIKILPEVMPPADASRESTRAFTQECTKILENIIREHPEQWTWIHRRWRTKPVPGTSWGADRTGYVPPGCVFPSSSL